MELLCLKKAGDQGITCTHEVFMLTFPAQEQATVEDEQLGVDAGAANNDENHDASNRNLEVGKPRGEKHKGLGNC